MQLSTDDRNIHLIGRLNRPHGMKGELLFTYSDDVFEESEPDFIFCLLDGILVPFFIEECRFRTATTAILKLEGIDSDRQAKRLTNTDIYLEYEKTEPDWNHFAGFKMTDTVHGELGTILSIDTTTANMLFVVQRGDKELLIPVSDEFIVNIDYDGMQVTVNIPQSLLSLNE